MTDNNKEIIKVEAGQVEKTSRTASKPRKDSFTIFQSVVLILLTLVVSIGGYYAIGQKFFWTTLDMKRVNQQLEYYKQQVQSNPSDINARISLGYTYSLKGNNDQAIQQFSQVIALDAKNFDAYYNLGLVLNKEKRYNEALTQFGKAAELSPRDYKVHLQKGIALRNLKMYKEAKDALTQANKLMPMNSDIIYEIGMVAEAQGQKDEAKNIYQHG